MGDPVNVNSPYWNNNSCSPFVQGSSCSLGHLASYGINVTSAEDVIAGIDFAREKNVRLTIKNTGHDFLGRSTGAGSLSLWTFHLKDISFSDYDSSWYAGPAIKLGAGVQGSEALRAASERGLRVVIGDCPSVGVAGGWAQGGGHGHLGPKYGLGADNILEIEVVTADGSHKTVSPEKDKSLFWAISGGGPGNYAIVLSMTFKAHPDGEVAGARLSFRNTDPDTYWQAVTFWFKNLLNLTDIPGMSAIANMNNAFFEIGFASLPDANADEMAAALEPFYKELDRLGIELDTEEIISHPTFREHYEYFTTFPNDVNNTLGNRLIPQSIFQDNLATFVSTIKDIVTDQGVGLALIGGNYSYEKTGTKPGAHAVLPDWRESIMSINLFLPMDAHASWEVLNEHQNSVNKWQDQLKAITPGNGAYMNEATYDNPDWKEDYFGDNFDKLLEVKKTYDPDHLFWVHAGVGSDEVWEMQVTGQLCQKA